MTARDHALFELDARRLPGWPAGLLARRAGAAVPADPRDRALAEQIVVGVVKNLLHLQMLIEHHAQRPLRRIDGLTQKIVAIGLYQLRFLTRIPESAAVNEAVEQAKRFGRGRAAGFVNAVLRKATRAPGPDPPDPATAPAEYARVVLSHPAEVFGRLEQLVPVEVALGICEHNNMEPPTIVRLFSGASEAELEAEGVIVRPHRRRGMYIVEGARPPLLAGWAERGIAQVQDPTSAEVVGHLDVRPGQAVLDRCAGVGTKTLQIRDLLGAEGRIVAVDPSEPRCRLLRGLVERRGLGNIAVRLIGMLEGLGAEDPRSFDRILMDVPCSNSGVLARRPEARYAQGAGALASLGALQDRILDDTAGALRPGGRAVYSTCSIWPEENEERIAGFLRRHPEYELVEERSTLPSLEADAAAYHDGGYFAVLGRAAE